MLMKLQSYAVRNVEAPEIQISSKYVSNRLQFYITTPIQFKQIIIMLALKKYERINKETFERLTCLQKGMISHKNRLRRKKNWTSTFCVVTMLFDKYSLIIATQKNIDIIIMAKLLLL